jgi:hypothetical protein
MNIENPISPFTDYFSAEVDEDDIDIWRSYQINELE